MHSAPTSGPSGQRASHDLLTDLDKTGGTMLFRVDSTRNRGKAGHRQTRPSTRFSTQVENQPVSDSPTHEGSSPHDTAIIAQAEQLGKGRFIGYKAHFGETNYREITAQNVTGGHITIARLVSHLGNSGWGGPDRGSPGRTGCRGRAERRRGRALADVREGERLAWRSVRGEATDGPNLISCR